MAYISSLYNATFGSSSCYGTLGVDAASLTNPVDAASLVNLVASGGVGIQLGGELAADQVRISDLGALSAAAAAFQGAMEGLKTTAEFDPAAVQELVDAYNNFTAAALPDSDLASDIAGGAERLLAGTFADASSATFLGEIGIAKNELGSLALDISALQFALNEDAAGTTSLINEAAKAFGEFVEPLTRAGDTIDNAIQRLQSQVNFLETRSSGNDYALTAQKTQAIRQYAAIMAMATGS